MIDLSPVFVPKAADVLADTLREQILNGRLGVGSLLPNERELSERAGLSRTSVREALRILEVEGLIATRTGRNGGSEVVRPTSATLERKSRSSLPCCKPAKWPCETLVFCTLALTTLRVLLDALGLFLAFPAALA